MHTDVFATYSSWVKFVEIGFQIHTSGSFIYSKNRFLPTAVKDLLQNFISSAFHKGPTENYHYQEFLTEAALSVITSI